MATGVRSLITGPTCWVGADLADGPPSIDLDVDLTRALASEGRAALERGETVDSLAESNQLSSRLETLRDGIAGLLDDGPGLVVVRGFPVGELGDDGAAIVAWSLAVALGEPLPQNKRGDRVYLVRDERSLGYEGVRGSKTSTALIYHSDAASGFANSVPDTFGLLSVRAARDGGRSLAISGHTVYNRLLDSRGDLVDVLFDDFCWDRSEEAKPAEDPVFRAPVFARDSDQIVVRYNRAWVDRGHALAGEPLSPRQREALEAVDAILAEPDLPIAFDLQPGDFLVVNNTVVLHNRTAFVDDKGAEGRLLYRVWVRRR